MKVPIYLDNHATTALDPRVLEKMLPCFTEWYGNASSRHHAYGWQAEELVREARQNVAHLLNVAAEEVIFTSGATESVNLAMKGLAALAPPQKRHVLTVATEHKAVLEVCESLQRQGFDLEILPVDERGILDLDLLKKSIRPQTLIVSVMAANNETGVLQPVAEIAAICREHGVVFHTDATQAVGKIPFDCAEVDADLVSCSAHKIYGPKGVGSLIVRKRRPRLRLAPLIEGGGHERGLRSGTLNVPGIVGFGEACRLAREEMPDDARRLAALRDRLEAGLLERVEGILVNGDRARRLPHSLNVSIPDVEGDSLITSLRDLAVSSGAACASADPAPSHVLKAMGRSDDLIRSSLRFGLGRFNTAEEIEFAVERVVETVERLRNGRHAVKIG